MFCVIVFCQDGYQGYTGVDVLSSPVPFQVTFSSRLASLCLIWKVHTWLLDGFARS